MLNRATGPFARALAAVGPDNDNAASSKGAPPPRAPTAHPGAHSSYSAGLAALALVLPGAASAFDQPFTGSSPSSAKSAAPSRQTADENPYGIVDVTMSTGRSSPATS